MKFSSAHFRSSRCGFTMVEVAISLAIIGIGLVAIIGVLPLGMNVQKDNREETIINQDASVFMEAIRNGALGADDLTNYVFAITNSWTNYSTHVFGQNGYTYSSYSALSPFPTVPINNGANIIGLLSTPEFVDGNGNPVYDISGGNYYSNHVVAYVRSISGPASEKPPQDNGIIVGDSFSYKLVCGNAPVAVDPNALSLYTTNLTANLHELRLTFLWPLLPNFNAGYGKQTFRTMIAGRLAPDAGNTNLYFYQPQTFTNTP